MSYFASFPSTDPITRKPIVLSANTRSRVRSPRSA